MRSPHELHADLARLLVELEAVVAELGELPAPTERTRAYFRTEAQKAGQTVCDRMRGFAVILSQSCGP